MGARPDLAERIYDECLKRLPSSIMIRERLIDLYLQFGKPEAAQAEMEVIALQRGNVTDWLRFGTISMGIKNLKSAESGFQQAAKVAPEAWEPHYNLGELYDSSNLDDLAGKEYEIAVKLNSGSYKPHNGMGLWLMKQNRWKEAIEQLKKAHQLAPLSAEPAYNLALVLGQTEQKSDAKNLLKQIDFTTAPDGLQADAVRLMNVL
jgi:Tfp pilus assembly protein PilF